MASDRRKDLLRSMADGPTLQQLTQRINEGSPEQVSSRSIGEVLVSLRDEGYVFLEGGRWWRTPEGITFLEEVSAEELAQRARALEKHPPEKRIRFSWTREETPWQAMSNAIHSLPVHLASLRHAAARALTKYLLLVLLVATPLFFIAGYPNQVPWYDDKAYLNNALLHSGRVDNSTVKGPHADERHPLFWWIITTLFLFNVPITWAKYVSPFFALLLAVLVYEFARRMFKSAKLGLFAALLLSTNAYFLLLTGMILSDVPGTTMVVFTLFSLYFGVVEKRSSYLVLFGGFLALTLIMRDSNLILLPPIIFFIVTRLGLGKYWKFLAAMVASMSIGVPAAFYGLVNSLTAVSTLITPVIIYGESTIGFSSLRFSSFFLLCLLALSICIGFSFNKSGKIKIVSVAISSVSLFFVLFYPYMWDNYLLGASYQIAGKGVLSRWVAHGIMTEQYGPIAQMSAAQRLNWWTNNIVFLISPAIVGFSLIGTLQMVRKKMLNEFTILVPSLLFITGFTVLTNYEARSLIPAIPLYILLAVYGISETIACLRTKLSLGKYGVVAIEVLLTASMTLSNNLLLVELALPTGPGTLASIDLLSRCIFGTTGWLSDYLLLLIEKTHPAHLLLDISYLAEAFVCLILTVGFLILAVNKDKRVEVERATVWEIARNARGRYAR